MSLTDSFANFHVYLYRYVVMFVYVFGTIGNLISLFILMKKTWRKTVCVFYFLVFIIINTIYLNSFLLGSICIYGFNIYLQNTSNILCKLYIFIAYSVGYYSPIVLILACIDRLLISSRNIDTRLYSSKRLAYFSVSISAIVWNLFCLHLLIKASIQEMYPTVFVCYFDLSTAYLYFIRYTDIIMSLFIYIMMITLLALSFKNVRHIQPVRRQQQKQPRSMTKRDFQLLRCLYTQSLSYVVFSVIFVINAIYSIVILSHTPTVLEQTISSFVANVGNFMISINYSASFIIFVGASKAFRQELKRMFYKITTRNLRVHYCM